MACDKIPGDPETHRRAVKCGAMGPLWWVRPTAMPQVVGCALRRAPSNFCRSSIPSEAGERPRRVQGSPRSDRRRYEPINWSCGRPLRTSFPACRSSGWSTIGRKTHARATRVLWSTGTDKSVRMRVSFKSMHRPESPPCPGFRIRALRRRRHGAMWCCRGAF